MENGTKETIIKGVAYDVDVANIRKQPDLALLEKFCKSEHDNMCIEYENHNECEKRRACLRSWLIKSEYGEKFYTSIRGNKLYILRERNFEE